MNSQLKLFEKEFSHSAKRGKSKDTSDYLDSRYEFLCFKAADVRKFKYEYYDKLDTEQKMVFLDILIKQSNISEVVSWALYRLDEFDIEDLIKHKRIILSFADMIENWWHSDQLSSVYSKMLDTHKVLFDSLRNFNNSQRPWLKRQSIVSLYYYSSMRKHPLPFEMAIPLVEKLLLDEDYYVQKGVGWTIRELSQLYYNKTLDFMRVHAKHISSTAFSTAAEKLEEQDKEELKAIRKKGVSNKYEFHGHRDEEISDHDLKMSRYKK